MQGADASGFSPAATPAIFGIVPANATGLAVRAANFGEGGSIPYERDAHSLRIPRQAPVIYRRPAPIARASVAEPATVGIEVARAEASASSAATPAHVGIAPASAASSARSSATPAVSAIVVARATSRGVSAATAVELRIEIADFDTIIHREERDPNRAARIADAAERYTKRLEGRKAA